MGHHGIKEAALLVTETCHPRHPDTFLSEAMSVDFELERFSTAMRTHPKPRILGTHSTTATGSVTRSITPEPTNGATHDTAIGSVTRTKPTIGGTHDTTATGSVTRKPTIGGTHDTTGSTKKKSANTPSTLSATARKQKPWPKRQLVCKVWTHEAGNQTFMDVMQERGWKLESPYRMIGFSQTSRTNIR